MRTKNSELIGNFEVTKDGIFTRREMLMMGALAAGSLAAGDHAADAAVTTPPLGSEPYAAKDFSELTGKKLDGLSASQVEQHIKLYQGYIKKANEIYNKLKDVDITSANATYAPLRELLMEQSYAVNG